MAHMRGKNVVALNQEVNTQFETIFQQFKILPKSRFSVSTSTKSEYQGLVTKLKNAENLSMLTSALENIINVSIV